MKRYFTRLIGTQVALTIGSTTADGKYLQYAERQVSMVLDSDEFDAAGITVLPNGLLCLFTCVGDEQPMVTFLLFKDWSTEVVEMDIQPISTNNLLTLFNYSGPEDKAIPQRLKDLISI